MKLLYILPLVCLLCLVQGCSSNSVVEPPPPPHMKPLIPLPLQVTDPGGVPPPPMAFLFIDGTNSAKVAQVLRVYFKKDEWRVQFDARSTRWQITMRPRSGTIFVYPCEHLHHQFCLDLWVNSRAAADVEAHAKQLIQTLVQSGARAKINCFYTSTHECVDSHGHGM